MSSFVVGLLGMLGKEVKDLENHSCHAHEVQAKSIADFQKEYEVKIFDLENFSYALE